MDGETEKNILGDAFFTEDNILRSNTKGVGGTGNGVLTQVYVDTDNKDVYIAVINTYLAVPPMTTTRRRTRPPTPSGVLRTRAPALTRLW